MARLTAIGLDADDTLWHNERFFRLTQERFADLLSGHVDADRLHERLLAAERRNLGHYGFGVKGFVLSMIETAIEVTEGQVPASVVGALIRAGHEMLAHPIELLPGAAEAVRALSGRFRLVLVTKGDLLDQERKLAQSGLGDLFKAAAIVSRKDAATYRRVFADHGSGAAEALMAGNSLHSDVLPMIDAGGWAVHLPHELTWALEDAAEPLDQPRYRRLSRIESLPALIAEIDGS